MNPAGSADGIRFSESELADPFLAASYGRRR